MSELVSDSSEWSTHFAVRSYSEIRLGLLERS